jgi:prepilin-type N-terminal cleavage/methylation domain
MPRSPSPGPLPRRRDDGFTLIELLTVIAIVGVLAAILVPVVGTARASARNAGCLSVLRQYGVAFNLFAAENRNTFPSGATDSKWYASLAPYMGAKTGPAQSRAGTCPELLWRFDDYAGYFTGSVEREDRRGYQYNRYLNRGGTNPPLRISSLANPSRTLVLWEGVGVGDNSRHVSGYPGGSYYYPKYRHGGKMNLLMVSGEVVTRRGAHKPDENETDASLPYEQGGINWGKAGEPFFTQ